MKKKFFMVLAFICICLGSFILLAWYGHCDYALEKIERALAREYVGVVNTQIVGDELHFIIEYGRTRGMYSFTVEDEAGDKVWCISMSSFAGKKIVYGVLPDSKRVSFVSRQNYPENLEKPKILIKDKRYSIYATWSSDTMFSAGSTSSGMSFTPNVDIVPVEPIQKNKSESQNDQGGVDVRE